MAHRLGYRDEPAPSPTTSSNQGFLESAANPWGALRLAATSLPADPSIHAARVLHRLRRCALLPPPGGFLPMRDLADPFASPRPFPAPLRAFAALRKSFALRASRNRYAIHAALPRSQRPHACDPAC